MHIAAGSYQAVVTEGGGALRALSYKGRPLLDGFEPHELPSGGRGQLLAPWPNRLRDGRYRFGGRELQLPLDEPARHNACHGLVRWLSWVPEADTGDAVSLCCRVMAQPGYPWTLELRVRYELSDEGLRVTQSVRNLADGPAPYASGAHPYVRLVTGLVDDWELELPAGVRMLSDERKLPVRAEPVDGDYDFRRRRTVGATVLDHAFTELRRDAAGTARVTVSDPVSGQGIAVWMDANHRWVMIYTGDDAPESQARRSIAIEPMTGPPDAFRSGTDLVVLAAAGDEGCEYVASWGITAHG